MMKSPTTGAGTAASSAGEVHPLGVGDLIPAVKVLTLDGEFVDLRAWIATQPTVLVFYRGGWCPYCSAQLSGLARIDPDVRRIGYRIVAVSPDQVAKLKESVAKHELTYTLLSDSSAVASKAFGLAFKVDAATIERYRGFGIDLDQAAGESHHVLPVPAVYVVGVDGKIAFAHWDPDYTKRLDTDRILAVVREAATTTTRAK